MHGVKWVGRRGRWSLVIAIVMVASGLGAVVAYGDNLQSDLNTTTGGLLKTVNLGTLPANTPQSQNVFLFVETQPSSVNDPTYPFNVTGSKAGTSTFPGSASFDGVTISGAGSAAGRTGHITWTTPPAQATAQTYTIVENFSANTPLNTNPATVTITFSVAAAPLPADNTAPDTGSIIIDDGAAWTNDTSASIDISAHDARGVTSYALAETQAGLGSASVHAVSPAEASFSRTNLPFALGNGDSAAKSAWVRFCDAADNCSDASDSIGLDTVKPVIAGSTGSYTQGTWTNQDVTVTFSCADDAGSANSGIFSDTVAGATRSSSGADQSVTSGGGCSDNAGNEADPVTVGNIDIDKDPPLLNINGTADGATFSVCSGVPNRPTFAPSDALSGLDGSEGDSWSTPSTASGVGTYTYSAQARDNAANSASETRQYTVNYGSAFGGYLQPINSDGSSRFKLGSTIPVKFQLTCGGTPITNAVAKLYVKQGDNAPDPGVDEAISTSASTTGNQFRYDSTAQQYIFNLSTKLGYTNPDGSNVSFSLGTWTLKILLDDGSWRSINIQLPR